MKSTYVGKGTFISGYVRHQQGPGTAKVETPRRPCLIDMHPAALWNDL